MSIEKAKDLLAQLQSELKNTDLSTDKKTQQQFKQLDADLKNMLSKNNLNQQDLHDGIMQMEYSFLTEHPMAANLMRGIVDMLSKAGI